MVVVDLEMSGLDPLRNSILSIGAVDYKNPTNTFYGECRLRDGAVCMPEALAVNGFTPETVNDPTKITEKQLTQEFLNLVEQIKSHVMVGHNPMFDISFLSHACKLYKLKWPFRYRSVDLHSIGLAHALRTGLIPVVDEGGFAAINSDVLSKYVGLPEEPKPHNGLNGAKQEAETLSRLVYGKNLLHEFSQ